MFSPNNQSVKTVTIKQLHRLTNLFKSLLKKSIITWINQHHDGTFKTKFSEISDAEEFIKSLLLFKIDPDHIILTHYPIKELSKTSIEKQKRKWLQSKLLKNLKINQNLYGNISSQNLNGKLSVQVVVPYKTKKKSEENSDDHYYYDYGFSFTMYALAILLLTDEDRIYISRKTVKFRKNYIKKKNSYWEEKNLTD